MTKLSPLITIGPTIPSKYLDNRLVNEAEYGFDLFYSEPSEHTMNWLNNKPKGSVIYVSFGSMTCLSEAQMSEIAFGLKGSGHYFLWVVRESEEAKLPKHLRDETAEKGLLVKWSPQVEVLANSAVGCFFTHCGWNSTVEALSLGVPMVGMPQWTDQTTDAKFVEDVWKVGIRVRVDENGIVGRKEVEDCIRQVMEGEKGREMKERAEKWRKLSVEAVSEGGTSDNNINEFVAKLMLSSSSSSSS